MLARQLCWPTRAVFNCPPPTRGLDHFDRLLLSYDPWRWAGDDATANRRCSPQHALRILAMPVRGDVTTGSGTSSGDKQPFASPAPPAALMGE